MASPHVRVDSRIKEALAEYSTSQDVPMILCANLAIVDFLKSKGVDIEYPFPKSKAA